MSFFNRESSRQDHPDYSANALVRKVWAVLDRTEREFNTIVRNETINIKNPALVDYYKDMRRNEFGAKARKELEAFTNTADIKAAYKSLPTDEPGSKSVLMDALHFLDQPLGQ